MSEFDFGELEEEMLPWYQESFQNNGNKVLLLDADYIAYTVGFCSTPEQYEQFENGKFDITRKYDHACFLIKDAMRKAKADAVNLLVTDSANNFRVKLVDDYKAQRATEKPPFWAEVRDWVNGLNCTTMSVNNEADDMVSILAHEHYKELDADNVPRTPEMYRLWSKYIIGSKDKDVDHVFGWHVDLETGDHYWVDVVGELKPKYKLKEVNDYAYWPLLDGVPVNPDLHLGPYDTYKRGAKSGETKTKRVTVGKREVERLSALKGTGGKFFYAQMIMGDPTDNYFGIPNAGMGVAFTVLDNMTTMEDCHKAVWQMYQEAFPDSAYEMFLLNGRLAWMQRYYGQLWSGEVFT